MFILTECFRILFIITTYLHSLHLQRHIKNAFKLSNNSYLDITSFHKDYNEQNYITKRSFLLIFEGKTLKRFFSGSDLGQCSMSLYPFIKV